jgi:hypothetical protein
MLTLFPGLPNKLSEQYQKGLTSGQVLFFESEKLTLEENGVQVSLSHKHFFLAHLLTFSPFFHLVRNCLCTGVVT